MTAPDHAPRNRAILRDAAAISLATGTYGVSFGAIAVTSGLDVWQACALSLLAFTGASQFAFVGVLGAGGSALSGTLTALLLGTRNTLYAVRLAPLLRGRRPPAAVAAHLVIDESTAMAVTRETDDDARTGFWATGLGVFVLWNTATLVGALAGDRIGDPRDYGLDAAVAAAFLALLWPRLSTPLHRVVAALGAALALCLVPLAPAGVPVLAAAVVALGDGPGPSTGAQRVTWTAVLVTCAGCYLLELLGVSVPARLLEHPLVQRFAELVPVALLAALVAVQALAAPARHLAVDARLAGLAVAFVALLLRAPFLVVVVLAALTAALLRLA